MTVQPILSIRATVAPNAVPAFTHAALERIRLYSRRQGIETAGGPFVTTHPSGHSGLVEVEAGWPTCRPCPGSDDIHAGALLRPRPSLHDAL